MSVVLRRTQLYLSRICIPCTCLIKRVRANLSTGNPQESKTGSLQTGLRLLFGKYLYITNTIASSALMSLGDLIQQKLESIHGEKHKLNYDWTRNLHMAEVGAFQGYVSHFFYSMLEKYIPGSSMSAITKKLLIDQGFFSPFCITVFFLGMGFLNRTDMNSVVSELRNKFAILYIADCCLYTPTQFINFYLFPPRFRVLYLSLMSVCYTVFLSFVKHND